jgi:hypothetical protein
VGGSARSARVEEGRVRYGKIRSIKDGVLALTPILLSTPFISVKVMSYFVIHFLPRLQAIMSNNDGSTSFSFLVAASQAP